VVLGGTGALLGLTLAANVAGAADFWAELATLRRPLGIDYSKSVFTRPGVVRLFGLAFAGVGVTFIAEGLTQTP
jgi:hypothetical protein